MKTIDVTISYTLFKPVKEININAIGSTLEFVRVTNSYNSNIKWMMGYENNFGTVSLIGGDLSTELSNQLEKEYQNTLKESCTL